MKRVKIMLMSLLVLAVVGGVLAFKVKFNNEYCTTPADANTCRFNNRTCPNFTAGAQMVVEGVLYCTTTPRVGAAEDKDCLQSDNTTAVLRCTSTKVAEILDNR